MLTVGLPLPAPSRTQVLDTGIWRMCVMIWTFKVELLYGAFAKEECVRVIEIESSSTLEDFHFAIQKAVDFDDDHLSEFYTSRTDRSRDRLRFDDENGKLYELTMENLYPLEKRKNLFYLFDYGDHWLFKISKSRKTPQQPEIGVTYPRAIKKIGKNPERYPMWEE